MPNINFSSFSNFFYIKKFNVFLVFFTFFTLIITAFLVTLFLIGASIFASDQQALFEFEPALHALEVPAQSFEQ